MNEKRKIFCATLALLTVAIGVGCQTMKKAAKVVGRATGNEKLEKGGESELEPKEEHYIGRAIAAQIFASSGMSSGSAQSYVNHLGQYLSAFSSRPSLYVGYRVALVESPVSTAMSTPGGFIFVSTGFLKQMENEDALAGVIAHEIAHISQRHTEKTLRKTRDLQAGVEAAKLLVNATGGKMSEGDFTTVEEALTGGTEIVMKKGVGKAYEFDADSEAVRILTEAGYDPRFYRAFVATQASHQEQAFSTHPSSQDRLAAIDRAIAAVQTRSQQNQAGAEKRKTRFLIVRNQLATKSSSL